MNNAIKRLPAAQRSKLKCSKHRTFYNKEQEVVQGGNDIRQGGGGRHKSGTPVPKKIVRTSNKEEQKEVWRDVLRDTPLREQG